MNLYVVRHGQTVWNAAGKLQGRADIELNENGRNAARELGKRLSCVQFDRIYSSPLKRAYETASLVRVDRNIPIICDDRLVEISFGDGEGDSWALWNSSESPYNAFFTDTAHYVPPKNGETLQSVMARTREFSEQVLESEYNQLKNVLLVAHGALLSALICHFEGYGVEQFWGTGLLHNCQAAVFTYDGKFWQRCN